MTMLLLIILGQMPAVPGKAPPAVLALAPAALAQLSPVWPADPLESQRRALAAVNARRATLKLAPLLWDIGLAQAAGDHCVRLTTGSEPPHARFPDRVRSRGWPYQNCGVRSGFGNLSEGIAWGLRSPEDVLILDGSPDPHEGHRRDFEDPAMNRVGIALAPIRAGPYLVYGGYVAVVCYGARCVD